MSFVKMKMIKTSKPKEEEEKQEKDEVPDFCSKEDEEVKCVRKSNHIVYDHFFFK